MPEEAILNRAKRKPYTPDPKILSLLPVSGNPIELDPLTGIQRQRDEAKRSPQASLHHAEEVQLTSAMQATLNGGVSLRTRALRWKLPRDVSQVQSGLSEEIGR